MQKEDIKSFITRMYENLLEQIETHDETTKEQIINYLQDVENIILTINENDKTSLNKAQSSFINIYKEIADESLSSYQTTNDRFAELSQMQAETMETTIDACNNSEIDIATISKKFALIHNLVADEVAKANSIIATLTKQVEELESTSNMDALTQVFNRRALTTYLDEICSNQNIPYELQLVIIDLDDFKLINDKFGHVAGDKVLIFISNVLRKTLREGDKIFRYGGEEFIIILNRIDQKNSRSIMNRLLHIISSNELIYKDESLRVTASVGATQYRSDDTPDTIISRADKALYRSKHNGKNQISWE